MITANPYWLIAMQRRLYALSFPIGGLLESQGERNALDIAACVANYVGAGHGLWRRGQFSAPAFSGCCDRAHCSVGPGAHRRLARSEAHAL